MQTGITEQIWSGLSPERKQYYEQQAKNWLATHPNATSYQLKKHTPRALAYRTYQNRTRYQCRKKSADFRARRRKRWRENIKKDPIRQEAYKLANNINQVEKRKWLKTCPHCDGEVSITAWKRRIENERQLTKPSKAALEKAQRCVQGGGRTD